MIGDLQTGTAPYLEQALGSRAVEFDYRNGRSSAEGVERLRLRLGPSTPWWCSTSARTTTRATRTLGT